MKRRGGLKFPTEPTMNTITIEDPREVAKQIDKTFGTEHGHHQPSFGPDLWTCLHWYCASNYVAASGKTPEELIEDIRAKIKTHDPLTKLRAEAAARGFALMPLPTD